MLAVPGRQGLLQQHGGAGATVAAERALRSDTQHAHCPLSVTAQHLQLVYDELNNVGCGTGDTVSMATEVQDD